MTDAGHRIMRIPLPVPLIREMDAVIIDGVGGYSTRAEFIVDAVQERILELTIGSTEDAGPPPALLETQELSTESTEDAGPTTPVGTEPVHPATMPMTALSPPQAGFALSTTDDLSIPEGRPLFGLHNRDYPSLWALNQLAGMTAEGPIPMEESFMKVLAEAWTFGELLLDIEKRTSRKCTALFPTNPDKRKAAETGFRIFAVGDYRDAEDETISTSGPLFEWRTVGLSGSAEEPLIGVTASGWQLLGALQGLSVEEPHAPSATAEFLTHLAEHAPSDMKGFIEILRAVGPEGASRTEVLGHMAEAWPDWTSNESSTNSAGYVARAREWGLIEPKQSSSKYHLTPLGHQRLNSTSNGVQS